MTKKIIFAVLIIITLIPNSFSQSEITIFNLYKDAVNNHPLITQDSLYSEQMRNNLSSIKKKFLPEMNINGTASYQSDVPLINLGFPGISLPEFPKDHYNLNLDIGQLIYDGGITKTLMKIEEIKTDNLKELTNKEIYTIYNSINEAYFSLLTIDENLSLFNTLKDDLNQKLGMISQGIKNSLSSQNDYDRIYSEILNLDEKIIDLNFNRSILLSTLNELTGNEFDNSTKFIIPEVDQIATNNHLRPEYKLLEGQDNITNEQIEMLSRSRYPKVAGFAQAGYGQPGYNMFNEGFSNYYMVGLKMSWNIYDWKITKDKQTALRIEKEITNNNKANLDKTISLAIKKLKLEVEKIKQQKTRMEELIKLKQDILNRSEKALDNGIISPTDYIHDLNELSRAQIQLSTYNIMESKIKMNIMFISGEIRNLNN